MHWGMVERLDGANCVDDICLLARDIKAKFAKLETEAANVGAYIRK